MRRRRGGVQGTIERGHCVLVLVKVVVSVFYATVAFELRGVNLVLALRYSC